MIIQIKMECALPSGLYRELTVFFHKTLQAGTKDRYPDMRQVLEQLERIERFGAEETVISCSGPAVVPEKWWEDRRNVTAFFTGGREKIRSHL